MLRQISSSAVLMARQGMADVATVPALSALAKNAGNWAHGGHAKIFSIAQVSTLIVLLLALGLIEQ